MDVSKYKFSSKEIENLKKYRDDQLDTRLKVRFIALLMIAKGIDLPVIALIIGKSPKTVENWLIKYDTQGIASLNSFQYKPKKTFLNDEQIELLVTWVKETNPGKTKAVRDYIKTKFNTTYSVEGVRQLLIKKGLKILRPKVIPGNPPSEEDQKKLLNTTLK